MNLEKISKDFDVNIYQLNNGESIIENKSIKMMLLGKETVGKTSFKCCIQDGQIPKDHIETLLDCYFFSVNGQGQNEFVKIQDSAGQEDYYCIVEQIIAQNDGFFIIYSIDDKESFENVQNIWKKIKSFKKDQSFYAVLIGNKKDKESSRQISYEQGQELANQYGIPFHEISLKNEPTKAKQIFIQLFIAIKKYNSQQFLTRTETNTKNSQISTCSKKYSFSSNELNEIKKNKRNNSNTNEPKCCECNIF